MKSSLFLAGAAVALVLMPACSQNGSDVTKKGTIVKEKRGLFEEASIDPDDVKYGDYPEQRIDGYPFNPIHDVLVFIRFNADGTHTGRVHYFKAGSSGNSAIQMNQRLAAAISALKADIRVKPPGSLNDQIYPPIAMPDNRPPVLRNLDNLHFSGQSNILVVVDNPGLNFRLIPLFFTKKLKNGDDAKENKAFYNADTFYVNIGAEVRPAIYLRNYFTKGNEGTANPGNTSISTSERQNYALNFNFTSASTDGGAGEQKIFDPDGGNMGSGGPPP